MNKYVLNVTIYGLEGEMDRYKVTTVRDGKLVEITEHYELVACADENGRPGWAVFVRTSPVERHVGPVRRDEDPEDVVQVRGEL